MERSSGKEKESQCHPLKGIQKARQWQPPLGREKACQSLPLWVPLGFLLGQKRGCVSGEEWGCVSGEE